MGMRDIFRLPGKVLRKRKLKRRGLSIGVKRKTGETRRVVSYFQASAVARVATGVAFVALAVLIIGSGGYYWPRPTVGERAMEDVYASVGFTFRDDAKTESLRDEAAHGVPVVYKLDETRLTADLDKLIALLKNASQAKDDSSSEDDLLESVNELLPPLGRDEVSQLVAIPNAAVVVAKLKLIIIKVSRYRITRVAIVNRPEETGVEVRSGDEVRAALRESIEKEFPQPANEETRWLPGVLRVIAYHFTSDLTPQYRREDKEALKKLRLFARRSVLPQHTTVRQGTKIIERGEEVSPTHVAQIEEMRKVLTEKRSAKARLLSLVGAAVAISAVAVGSAAFLARFHRSVFASNSRLILIAVLVLMSVGLSKVLTYMRAASVFLAYPIAVPFGSFVLSMMLGLRLAAFVTIPMAILLAMGFGSSLSPVLVGTLGGWAAAFFAGGVRHRKDFIKTGAAVGFVNGLTIAAIGALTNKEAGTLVVQAGGGVAVAMGSILLAAVFLPAFEWMFKIPTNVTLVELTDCNHPLLKRTIMETPGTYYHSLMVGNLAESAAEAVGANPLLARVGSHFHDIGKLKKPLYFSENEAFGKSKHDTLTPSMSNLIILSHTKDGVDLACKHKLNRVLIDIIKQHHGTSLDYYFYRRAEEINEGDSAVDEKEFRYPGPRPQSRESAIIMLADSVEAASRSLEKPTTAKIRAAVRNIIRMKFEDGQLDECDLTLKDLHKIEETFNRILLNTLHHRVKYPEEGKEDKGETSERPVQELAKDSGSPTQ